MKITKSILKKILGVALIIFGFIALLVPLLPFSWVAFIGFELLGIGSLLRGKIKAWFKKDA